MDFARKIQPFRSADKFQQVADALNGAQEAQGCNVTVSKTVPISRLFAEKRLLRRSTSGPSFYVDPVMGKDDGNQNGTMQSPFLTIGYAVNITRKQSGPSTIFLRKGTFYLDSTIELGPSDSGLTITNYQDEEVWISGGKVIKPSWKNIGSGGSNMYMADLSSTGITDVPGFRVDNMRGIRARYPNADPELGFGSSLKAKSWAKSTLPSEPDQTINPDTPVRSSGQMFQHYQLGVGGCCKNFVPDAGYWCGSKTQGGGAFTYHVPSGMVADKSVLPNQPYTNATGAVVQCWRPGHWASWMFEVGDYDSGTGTFTFSKGGFQGARGNSNGDEFYIENVMEELDSPNEWYFDPNTLELSFWYNASAGTVPPADTPYVVTQLKTLIKIVGTQDNPVKGVNISGVNFRDTRYTYLDPHGMPSGGDWGLQRMGAIYLEGTEMTVIEDGIFSRLDGNAIMISGYNRNATVQRNEFVWIGDTAIASWGDTTGTTVPGMGWDGTDGNQPRFNRILYNFVHELGIWEKQSSFYFQAKSCQNEIRGNIFFNGPRAGINFNDGFGGGSNITENLLFNTCRESGDHGPFNSWDRQVYVTKVKNGTAQPDKAYDNIYSNFIIANYNSQEAIDNDDGSNNYNTHDNFFAYSGNGMKNDFGGHDNHHHNNIYAYVGHGYGIVGQLPGHVDMFYDNTVVMTKDGDYGNGACSGSAMTVVHDNRIHTPTGKVTECGMSLKDWQAKGNDPGTTADVWPSDDDLVSATKKLLDF